ncbi:hypothetical protein AAVH_34799, partial [Aphelenchoides avenae]
MLLFTVLATLLCSPLVDARQAPVDSTEALTLCQSQQKCNNPALDIDEGTFFPTIKASGVDNLKLAVKSKRPLVFTVRAENYAVVWEITRPAHDECVWKIGTERDGTVTFKDYSPSKTVTGDSCFGSTGRDVSVTVDVKGKNVELADVTDGSCKKPIKLSACDYTLPDSTSIPDFDVWTLTISASGDADPAAIIKLKDAYVVYEAPDPTTPMTPGNNVTLNGTTIEPNSTTHKPDASTTADVGLSWTMAYGLMGGCALFFVLFVIAVIVAAIACIKFNKLKKERSPVKEGPRKKDGLDDRSKPIPPDGNGILPEIAAIESKSKRMVDEKQLEAAETAQNPAPGEAPTELKSQ